MVERSLWWGTDHLVSERGWSRGLIDRHLGSVPPSTIEHDPRVNADRRLWAPSVILAVEASPAWRADMAELAELRRKRTTTAAGRARAALAEQLAARCRAHVGTGSRDHDLDGEYRAALDAIVNRPPVVVEPEPELLDEHLLDDQPGCWWCGGMLPANRRGERPACARCTAWRSAEPSEYVFAARVAARAHRYPTPGWRDGLFAFDHNLFVGIDGGGQPWRHLPAEAAELLRLSEDQRRRRCRASRGRLGACSCCPSADGGDPLLRRRANVRTAA